MKYLALLKQCEGGFEVSVPRLPGCQSHGATEEEAMANITRAVRDYLTSNAAGVDDVSDVEVVAAVELPPEGPRQDGLDEVYAQARRDFTPERLEKYLFDEEMIPF